LRLEITTLAPSFASSSAEERPMPRLEPVDDGDLAGEIERGVFQNDLPDFFFAITKSRHARA